MRTDGGCFAQTSIPVTTRNKASGLRSVAHQCATPADVGSWHVPGRRVPNRGNVVEDPLWDRIADGGNPGCQGQVATQLSQFARRRRMTAMGQILSFDRGAGGEGSRLGVEIRNQLDQQPKEAVMAAIDYRSDRHPTGRRRSPRAAEKEDGSACAARGARASAAREKGWC